MRYKEIPECWEELTERQFKYLLLLLEKMFSRADITTREVLCYYADFLLGRRKYLLPTMQERYLALVFQIADKLNWIFEPDDDGQMAVNFNTTVNLLPRIKKLIGPQDHGSDLLFGEYRKAVEFYNRYTEYHDINDLHALCGLLYRKPSGRQDFMNTGSKRKIYNKHLINKYAGSGARIPSHLQYGIYLWFGHFCKFIVDGGVFIIEGNEVCFSEIFESNNYDPDEKQESSLGMLSVLFTLADQHTFGNENETDNTELFKVLLKLLHDKYSADRITRQ